jgi:hypothetical protein
MSGDSDHIPRVLRSTRFHSDDLGQNGGNLPFRSMETGGERKKRKPPQFWRKSWRPADRILSPLIETRLPVNTARSPMTTFAPRDCQSN